jgi:5-methylthioadenosine/S-adenosylhomocysteine deaminase
MIDLLLTGGTVVTIDQDRRVIRDGAVAIDKGRIVAVGAADEIGQQYRATKTVDCNGKAILPGLIDAHGHGGHSLIKTIGADTPTFWMRIVTATRLVGISPSLT